MKITGVRAFYHKNDRTLQPWHKHFWQFGVEVETDVGLTGIGAGGGGVASIQVVEHALTEVLVGRDPEEVEALWDEMFWATLPFGRKGIAVMAISALDIALWDLIGKACGKPVHQCLGGRNQGSIPAYATGNNVEELMKRGFRAFKLYGPDGPSEGSAGMLRNEKMVAEARELVGDDADLMLDCGMKWSVDYTLSMMDRLRPYRLNWIEEPLVPDDYEGYALITRESDETLIATGEHEYTEAGFKLLLDGECAQIIQPDVTWCGGITQARRICRLAEQYDVSVIPHRGGEVWGIHVVAAAECPLAEVVLADGRIPNFPVPGVEPLPVIQNGEIRIPQQSGIGVRWIDAP